MDMSAQGTPQGLAGGIPDPPPALTRRIEEAIGALHADQSLATASADTLLLAAERLFEDMLRGGCVGRTSALELLVVDALVTYAFERASDDPEQIESKAERAMLKLAAFPSAGDTSVTG
jgi:hypothetical protein